MKDKDILQYVADDLGLLKNDILDYDLYLYNMDGMEIVGADKDMIASPRLDNVTSVSALVDTMCRETNGNNTYAGANISRLLSVLRAVLQSALRSANVSECGER